MYIDKDNISRIIELADLLIAAVRAEKNSARRYNRDWLVQECETIIETISRVREDASSGRLEAGDGAGLGITRALSEMGASENIHRLCLALESCYQKDY